jgi:hypothetical protein
MILRPAPVQVVPYVPLTPVQKVAVALEILADYVRVRWLLRSRDLRGALATLRARRRAPVAEPGSLTAEEIGVRLGYLVWSTLRLLPTDSRCLMQALVLSAVLARRGLDGELVIGVKSDPEFEAHAWIEHNGCALLPHSDYTDTRLVEV